MGALGKRHVLRRNKGRLIVGATLLNIQCVFLTPLQLAQHILRRVKAVVRIVARRLNHQLFQTL